MVEVCGKNWEIIIAVITGEPGFFILKTTTAGVKMERAPPSLILCGALAVFSPRRPRALIFSFSKHARVNFLA
jgi:hypothetical protein